MKTIKISVVIPAYNAEKWVAQCIENILCQTYKNVEIIVVDDGSKDATAEIAARYPVNLLRQPNGGISVARNNGFDAATGDYIHFMDVDDWINLEFYEHMVDAITLTDADMALVGETIHEVKPAWTHNYKDRLVVKNMGDKFELTNVHEYGYTWRYLFKKSFIDKNELRFEVGRYIEDMPYTLQAVYLADKIVTVPGAKYYYKKRQGSVMNRKDKEGRRIREEHWQLTKKFRDQFVKQNGLEGYIHVPPLRHQYKILEIPMLERFDYKGKTKWYLFKVVKVLQRQRKGWHSGLPR